MTRASRNARSRGGHVPGSVLGAWLAALLLAACSAPAPERAEREQVAVDRPTDTRPEPSGHGAEDTGDHDGEEPATGESGDDQPANDTGTEPADDTGDDEADVTEPADEPGIGPVAEPAQVSIPAIGVTSGLVNLGTDDDGRMEVPQGRHFDTAGWYRLGPRPGEKGPAIVAGHIDSVDGPSVFFELDRLEPGDEIEITDHDGVSRRFVVDRTEQYAKDEFPTEEVYGDTDGAELRLITCGGPFDQAERSYDDNVVVYASHRT
jgi:sortase (surface protein transpeptidase)